MKTSVSLTCNLRYRYNIFNKNEWDVHFIMDHPKLFISYSHDSQEHKDWVKKLATDLRQHMGINVIFDQFHLRLGEDISFYMEQGLSDSSLVLCICTSEYVQKANSGMGGTGYEKMILTQSVLKNTNRDFIIPVVRNNQNIDKTPIFLGTKLYIDFSNDDVYFDKLNELVARIYNEDILSIPPIGENPFLNRNSSYVDTKNALDKAKYHDPQMSGTVTFNFSNNDGLYIIGSGEYQFTTMWTECGANSIYAYKDRVKLIGYRPETFSFPSPQELKIFDYTSRSSIVSPLSRQ